MSLECPETPTEAAQRPGPLGRVLLPYRRIATIDHLPALLTWSLAGRLHMTGTSIALTFLVAGWTGSYAYAGVVAALLVTGTAIAGPVRGRAADRMSATRLLTITASGYSIGLATIALLPAAIWYVAPVIALGAGLFMPPVTQLSRSSWSRITSGPSRDATFAAEATLQELLFIAGPMLAAGIVALANARIATLCCAAFAGFGALGFAGAVRRAGLDQPPTAATDHAEPSADRTKSGRNPFTLLTHPGLLRLILVMLLVVGSLSAADLVMVAWSRERGTPGLAGILAAAWAVGSLIGGLVTGGFHRPARLPVRLGVMAAGIMVLAPLMPPVLHSPPPWLIAVLLIAGGTAIAPTIAATSALVSETAPGERRGEAFGWFSTASTAGSALAAPITGWLLDQSGPAAGLAGAGACTIVALGMSVRLGQKRQPVPATG